MQIINCCLVFILFLPTLRDATCALTRLTVQQSTINIFNKVFRALLRFLRSLPFLQFLGVDDNFCVFMNFFFSLPNNHIHAIFSFPSSLIKGHHVVAKQKSKSETKLLKTSLTSTTIDCHSISVIIELLLSFNLARHLTPLFWPVSVFSLLIVLTFAQQ